MLEIKGLKVMYGKSIAIYDVNLSVPEGGIITLVGANGAGKSTTLNACLGVVPVAEGSVSIRGEGVTRMPTADKVKRGLVLAPEGRHLFPYLSVYKNLILGAAQRTDKNAIQEDLEFVFELFPRLKERLKQKAGTLSGGEQQMTAIARAMMADPKLLCLDEPSLGLAPGIIADIGEKIQEINRNKGTSILLVEQNVSLAFSISEYCYMLQVGELVAEGSVSEIRNSDVVRKAYFGG
ncbi:MAG: ABC transporter ATP-binding protein [Oscillospiraceae bacterium]|nr:ABC transporter ATP-binding protein [Oscillospiraceae bacterium]